MSSKKRSYKHKPGSIPSSPKRLELLGQQHPPLATLLQRSRLEPERLTPLEVQHLQQTLGNGAVSSLLVQRDQAATKPLLTQGKITAAIRFNTGQDFSEEAITSLRTALNVTDDPETGISEKFVLAVAAYQAAHSGLGKPDGKIGSGTLASLGESYGEALSDDLKERVEKAKRRKLMKSKGVDYKIVERIDKPEIKEIIERVSEELGLSPNIVRGIIAAESGGSPEVGKGTKGYKGLMQAEQDVGQLDPETSIRAGVTKFLKFRKQSKKMAKDFGVNEELSETEATSLTMVSYNAGPGSVKKAMQYAQEAGDARNWFEDEHFIRSLMYYGAYSTSMMKSKLKALGGDSLAAELEEISDLTKEEIEVAYKADDKWDVNKLVKKFISELERERGDSTDPKQDRTLAEAEALAGGWLVQAARFKHNNLRTWYVGRVLKYQGFYDEEQGLTPPAPLEGIGPKVTPAPGATKTPAGVPPAEAELMANLFKSSLNIISMLLKGENGSQPAGPEPATPAAGGNDFIALGQLLLQLFTRMGIDLASEFQWLLGSPGANGTTGSTNGPGGSAGGPAGAAYTPPTPEQVKAAIIGAMKKIKPGGATGNNALITNLAGQNTKMMEEIREVLKGVGTTPEAWFADIVPDATFLGVQIRGGGGSSFGGVHKELLARLNVAETILMEMPRIKALNCSSPAEVGQKIGVTDIGGLRAPKAATGGEGPSLHSYGLAVDINPAQNPYVRYTGSRIIERATELVLGEKITIDDKTDMVLHDVGKSLASYDRFKRASEALKLYLRLRDNPTEVAKLLEAHGQAHDEDAVKAKLAEIEADFQTAKTKVGVNNLGKNPAKFGIITLNRDLVEALVRAGVGWAGRLKGGKDIQHFDLDNATIKPKRRTGH